MDIHNILAFFQCTVCRVLYVRGMCINVRYGIFFGDRGDMGVYEEKISSCPAVFLPFDDRISGSGDLCRNRPFRMDFYGK